MPIQGLKVNISDYTYNLGAERIAQHPLEKRHDSKLLFYKSGEIKHDIFKELPNLLPKNSHLVFNDTKVIPARIIAHKPNGTRIEVFLLEPVNLSLEEVFQSKNSCIWSCIVGNKKKWKEEETIYLNENISLKWADYESNQVEISWQTHQNFLEILEEIGKVPLPPYMNRDSQKEDSTTYQTVFADKKGAVAAPTASLHFTNEVLENLSLNKIPTTHITLHVGAGTFLPVKVENALEHPMHAENMIFSKESIYGLLQNLDFIIPAGTTALRSLESLYWFGYKLHFKLSTDFFIEKLFPYEATLSLSLQDSLLSVLNFMEINNLKKLQGKTEIMIMPSYIFKICKGIITNFHQPNSTLLLLIAALVGKDKWKDIYNSALENQYRFLSYGDSSLLIP